MEDGLESANETDFDREKLLGGSVRRYAEAQVRQHQPPNRKRRTVLGWWRTALASACIVILPQHLLLATWDVPLGGSALLAIAITFVVLGLVNWPWLSVRSYNGPQSTGVFRYPGIWAFIASLPLGHVLHIYAFDATMEGTISWSWQASLGLAALTAIVSTIYARSAKTVVSQRLDAPPDAEPKAEPESSGSGWVRVCLAVLCLGCELLGWWISDGLAKDFAAILVLLSCLFLLMSFPTLGGRTRSTTTVR